jgi:hypothetical protein
MADTILVAMVNALPGQEDEFEAWYAEHMREVAAVPGVQPGTRYRVTDVQAPGAATPTHRYLTVYEIDGDVPEILRELVQRRADGTWTPRRGIDNDTIRMWAYERC